MGSAPDPADLHGINMGSPSDPHDRHDHHDHHDLHDLHRMHTDLHDPHGSERLNVTLSDGEVNSFLRFFKSFCSCFLF